VDFKFLVKWVGYPDFTWEERDQIEKDTKDSKQELGEDDDDFDLEEDFYTTHPDAPRPDDPVEKRHLGVFKPTIKRRKRLEKSGAIRRGRPRQEEPRWDYSD
jgi:hypothetical protein